MTIYDIARESGVSISTVSRVLNNHSNVRMATRDRVMEILDRHNYVPSSIAKSMVNKATRTVGVMTMDVRHMHYANIAFTIEQKLSTYGYNVILCNTGYDKQKMEAYYRVLAEKQVDGVILVGSVFSCEETGRSLLSRITTPLLGLRSTPRTGVRWRSTVCLSPKRWLCRP